MTEDNNDPSMRVPINELDFSLMTTNSTWGTKEISPELRERLNKMFVKTTGKKQEVTTQSLWDLMGYYTRDMRLANLSVMTGEVRYCRYYIDLAGDFLNEGFIEPFIICLSRSATMLELSQSKGGFFRRQANTFTREDKKQEFGPPKKKLFGGKDNQEGGF